MGPPTKPVRFRYAYVILEDGQGKQTLAKYRVNLPKQFEAGPLIQAGVEPQHGRSVESYVG
jgi:hypothetical protein